MARTGLNFRITLARWGGLGVALLLGSALVLLSFINYRDAQNVSRDMAVREGVGIFQHMRLDLAADETALRAALERGALLRDVRYLAVWDRARVRVAVGKSEFPGAAPTPLQLQRTQDRARMSFPAWFSKMGQSEPPAAAWSVVLVLEFEPSEAEAFTRRALINLVLASGVALLLMSAAVVLSQLGRRTEALRADLERQQHLAHLGKMSAVLAHEIRNPLAALKGHAQLVAENPRDPRTPARIGRVIDAAARLEILSNDLLDFARSGAVRPVETSPRHVLEAAVATTKPERIELSTNEAPRSWSLDALRMEQVLINLIENALQVTPPGERASAAIRVESGELVFQVRDHGPGVPLEERARIFDPFYTTGVRGTGLGLSVARRIVELHGGRVEVDDAPGGGALFRVRVPATPYRPSFASEPSHQPDGLSSQPKS